MSAWPDFLEARKRLIAELTAQGQTLKSIALALSCDANKVRELQLLNEDRARRDQTEKYPKP